MLTTHSSSRSGRSRTPPSSIGTCFARAFDPEAFDEVLADLRAGLAERVAIVVPPEAPWTLPAYELALMIAAFMEQSEVTVVTPSTSR